MVRIEQKETNRYFLLILILLAVILAGFLLKSYIVPVLTGALLAYIFFPVYELIKKKIKNENASAFIVSVLIILIISIPLAFLIFEISKEANIGYILLKQKIAKGNLLDFECTSNVLCSTINYAKEWINQPEIRLYVESWIKKGSGVLAEKAFKFAAGIPQMVLNIFITFFVVFYFFVDGKKILSKLEEAVPLKEHARERIFKQIKEVTKAIIYGFFLIAILEGIIAMITFSLAGIHSPILLGILIAITALIPFVGAAILWVPIMIMQFYNGAIYSALIVAIGGLIISFPIDTLLRPKIIGDQAKVHPILILLGFLGGLSLFGTLGIIIGPLVLSLMFTLIELYKVK